MDDNDIIVNTVTLIIYNDNDKNKIKDDFC